MNLMLQISMNITITLCFLTSLILTATETNENKIWIIRHVDKEPNKHYFYMNLFPNENYKWEISENGKSDAELIGNFFEREYKHKKIPIIYSSSFLRCIQTATPIAKQLKTKIRIENGFIESFHGLGTKTEMLDLYANYSKYIDFSFKPQLTAQRLRDLQLVQYTDEDEVEKRQKFMAIQHKLIQNLIVGQEVERKDIIIITHQKQVYKFGRSLVSSKFSSYPLYELDYVKKIRSINAGDFYEYAKNEEQKKFTFIEHHKLENLKSEGENYLRENNTENKDVRKYDQKYPETIQTQNNSIMKMPTFEFLLLIFEFLYLFHIVFLNFFNRD
jgi:broad specificity phosphatase PhoE